MLSFSFLPKTCMQTFFWTAYMYLIIILQHIKWQTAWEARENWEQKFDCPLFEIKFVVDLLIVLTRRIDCWMLCVAFSFKSGIRLMNVPWFKSLNSEKVLNVILNNENSQVDTQLNFLSCYRRQWIPHQFKNQLKHQLKKWIQQFQKVTTSIRS